MSAEPSIVAPRSMRPYQPSAACATPARRQASAAAKHWVSVHAPVLLPPRLRLMAHPIGSLLAPFVCDLDRKARAQARVQQTVINSPQGRGLECGPRLPVEALAIV